MNMFKVLLMVLSSANIILVSIVSFSSENLREETVSGVISRVDEESESVYITVDSRLVRFKGGNGIYLKCREHINSSAEITFIKTLSGDLRIVSVFFNLQK